MKNIIYRIILSSVFIGTLLLSQVANGELKKTVRIGSVTYYEMKDGKRKKAVDEDGVAKTSSRDIEDNFEEALEKYMKKNNYTRIRIEVVE